MKNTRIYTTISLCIALALVFLFDACKKDDDNGNNGNSPSCYILSLTDEFEEYINITFSYNNNQLIRIDATEDGFHDYKTMQYDGNGNIVRIDYFEDDGTLFGYQTFEYSNGKVTKGYEHTNNDAVYDFKYNANGLLESVSLSSSKSASTIHNTITQNYDGLMASRLFNKGADTKRLSAIIEFQWNSNGSVTKEIWMSGGTLLESYDYTYDNETNPYHQFKFPVPIIGGAYAKTISSNNFIKEIWYSAINEDSQTTTATYQYNSDGYPTFWDAGYRMKYRCD